MRRPVVIVGLAAAIVAALAIALAVAIRTVDPQSLARPLQQKVREATGRELVINGPIELGVSLTPRLVLRDVSLSNPPWAATPELLRVKELDIQLALLPLLGRRVELRKVKLIEPVIALETDAQGRHSWDFSRPQPGGAPGIEPAGDGTTVVITELAVERGVLSYRSAGGATKRVDIARLALHSRTFLSPLEAELEGAVDGTRVSLKATTGALATLLDRAQPFPVQLDGDIGGRKLVATAEVLRPDDGVRLQGIDLRLGDSGVAGTLAIATRGQRRAVSLAMTSPRLALSELAILAAAAPAAKGARQAPAAPSAFLLSDRPLPLSALMDVDLDADLRIAELVVNGDLTVRDLTARIVTNERAATVPSFAASALGGRMEGQFAVRGRGDAPGVTMEARGRDLQLGALLQLFNTPRRIEGGATSVDLRLASRGHSLHEWASRADGAITVVVGPARVQTGSGDSALARVGAAMRADKAGSVTRLTCAVVRLPLRNGIAKVERSIAAETEFLDIAGSGTVDFARERMDLHFRPRVRAGVTLDVGVLGQLVHLQGSWRDPQVGIDPVASASAVAALSGVFATGGLSAVAASLFATTATRTSPCAEAMTARSTAATAATPGVSPPGGSGSIPQDIGRALGRLLGR